jgi:protein SCO1/2/putative membrane protein
MSAWRWGRPLLGLLFLLAAAGPASAAPPPDLGPVGPFRLTERSGEPITDEDLLGKVWIASFQFTRCSGPCPQVSRTLARLQGELAGRRDLRLVTFTIDPEHDDPETLTRYAQDMGAEPERWLFLTGKEADIHRLARDSFKLHVARRQGQNVTPGTALEHSPKLALVDRHGHIRGYFDGLPDPNWPDSQAQFEADMRKLRRAVDQLLAPELPGWMPEDFPRFNAALNAVAAGLILLGWVMIRRRQVRLHIACMLSALAVSALFLASYLFYHLVVKEGRPTRFADQAPGAPAWMGHLYLGILGTHTVLAVLAAPLALTTAYLGLRDRLARHTRLARWTLPIWLYVSVTGVVVYWMLYRLYPAG